MTERKGNNQFIMKRRCRAPCGGCGTTPYPQSKLNFDAQNTLLWHIMHFFDPPKISHKYTLHRERHTHSYTHKEIEKLHKKKKRNKKSLRRSKTSIHRVLFSINRHWQQLILRTSISGSISSNLSDAEWSLSKPAGWSGQTCPRPLTPHAASLQRSG